MTSVNPLQYEMNLHLLLVHFGICNSEKLDFLLLVIQAQSRVGVRTISQADRLRSLCRITSKIRSCAPGRCEYRQPGARLKVNG
jgi:hypothetical protein